MAAPVAEAGMVRRRGVIRAAVVPDGKVVDVLPAVSDLQVMVLNQQPRKPILQVRSLVPRHTVDVLQVVPDGVQRPPARDGICPHYRVNGFKFDADLNE